MHGPPSKDGAPGFVEEESIWGCRWGQPSQLGRMRQKTPRPNQRYMPLSIWRLGTGGAPAPGCGYSVRLPVSDPAERSPQPSTHALVRRLERTWHLVPGPQAQLSEQELHYASLLRLPEPCRQEPTLNNRKVTKEDPSTDYACIAKNKPT
nr:leukocyte-specific transcript 1 protein isoform X1 [Manis javanica]